MFNKIVYKNSGDLTYKGEVIRFMLREIDGLTPYLAPFEKVKNIALLKRDLEIEEGEITPTLKLKRNIIE